MLEANSRGLMLNVLRGCRPVRESFDRTRMSTIVLRIVFILELVACSCDIETICTWDGYLSATWSLILSSGRCHVVVKYATRDAEVRD